MPRPDVSKQPAPPQSAPAPDSQYFDALSSLHKPIAVNWLKHWGQRRKGQVWGFVGFRAADKARWNEFEEEVRRIIDIQFESAGLELPDLEDIRGGI